MQHNFQLAVLIHMIEFIISKLGSGEIQRPRTRSQGGGSMDFIPPNQVELQSVLGAQKILNNSKKQKMILFDWFGLV